MNKKALTEADIRTKFITPALTGASGERGEAKKADYILSYKPNLPLAIIEAKANNHPIGGGMQRALDYAEPLDLPFAYSSTGDAFLEALVASFRERKYIDEKAR